MRSLRVPRPRCVRPTASGLTAFLLVVAGPAQPDLAALDYYRWRGPDANGVSQETGWAATWPQDGPKSLWKANVGIGFSSFAVASGRAYTMGNRDKQDTVYCFDAVSGQERWKYSYDSDLGAKFYEGGTHATPTVDSQRVYTLSKFGQLFCFEADSGKVVWSKDLVKELSVKVPTWGFAGSVLVEGGRLFVNVGRYGTALDTSGKVIWTTGPEASGYSTFVPFTMGNQKGLAILAARAVAGVAPDTGKVLWEHPWKTDYDVNAADPIILGDEVFVSSGYQRGAALVRFSTQPPSVVWESKVMRNHQNNCVLVNGYLYGFDNDENTEFKCVEFKTGEAKWAEKSLGKGALMAADGRLVILSGQGELVIAPADPAAFKPTARAQVLGGKCWTTPVLSNGRVYCRNAAGDVVCVDVSGK